LIPHKLRRIGIERSGSLYSVVIVGGREEAVERERER